MAKSYFYNERNLNKYIQPKLKKYNNYTYQKLSEEDEVLNYQINDESIAIDKANNRIAECKKKLLKINNLLHSIRKEQEEEKDRFRQQIAQEKNYYPPKEPEDSLFKLGNIIPLGLAFILAPIIDQSGYWLIGVPVLFIIIKVFTWIYFHKQEGNQYEAYKQDKKRYYETIDKEFNPSDNYNSNLNKIYDLVDQSVKLEAEEKDLHLEVRKRKFEIVLLKKVIKELPRFKKKAADKEKTAKVNAMEKKNRYGAQGIKNKLLKEVNDKTKWKCPYCDLNNDLDSSVADHIHPVNKGGLSVIQNLVLICKKCNSDKSNLLLRKFCKKKEFDFDEICDRLEQLGKDI